jgi:beta-lactamase class A
MDDVCLLSRRAVLVASVALLGVPAQGAALSSAARDVMSALRALEARSGARIGVASVDSGKGRAVFWREGERFRMCSTFKLSLAGVVLALADTGKEDLSRLVKYEKPVLEVSPATTRNWPRGMTVAQLCEAAIIYSDNTAANVLLGEIGGPGAVTAFWRSLGDRTSRLDDVEPKLNVPDGERNTTTPAAMIADMKVMLLGEALSAASRARLLGWMAANRTGGKMLRAGLPPSWRVADKTGHWMGEGNAASVNDLAFITPPDRAPILAAVFTNGGSGDDDARVAVVADVGQILAKAFA